MRKVVIWGIGHHGENAYVCLSKSDDYDIIAVCDSKSDKIGTIFNGIEVQSPENVFQKECFDIVLLCAEKWEGMYLKAKEYGVSDDVIYCWNNKIVRKEDTYSISIHSQDGEELFLREVFASRKNGIYVDVGAHHPIRYSNTLWAHELGWKGINIEPDFDNFKLFEIMRPMDINVNVGISDKEGKLKFYRFDESCFNTFDEKRAGYISNICGYQMKDIVTVPVLPLQDVLNQYNITHVDFMDIDVEEHEMEVLKSIHLDIIDVDIILVEQLDSTLNDVVQSDIAIYLKQYGYIVQSKFDRTVIYRKENKK